MLSLAMLLSDLPQTFSQSQGIVVVTAVKLSHVSDVPRHGLVALLLLVESFSHVSKPLIHLLHTHTPHHQPANPPHRLGIWGNKRQTQITCVLNPSMMLYIWKCTGLSERRCTLPLCADLVCLADSGPFRSGGLSWSRGCLCK